MSEETKKSLAKKVRNFFVKIGNAVRDFIIKIGDKIADWIISLRNDQIKELKGAVDNLINENGKRVSELTEAADLVLNAEIELSTLAYENKILEDLAMKKMREIMEVSHDLELLKKETEIEKAVNESIAKE